MCPGRSGGAQLVRFGYEYAEDLVQVFQKLLDATNDPLFIDQVIGDFLSGRLRKRLVPNAGFWGEIGSIFWGYRTFLTADQCLKIANLI